MPNLASWFIYKIAIPRISKPLILGICINLAGCTGMVITNAVFAPKWIGKPASVASNQWGRPNSVSLLPDGQTIEYWAFLKNHSFQEVVGGTTRLVAPNVIEQQSIVGTTTVRDDCEIYLTVDQKGIISDFKVKQSRSNSCTAAVNLRPPP